MIYERENQYIDGGRVSKQFSLVSGNQQALNLTHAKVVITEVNGISFYEPALTYSLVPVLISSFNTGLKVSI